VYVPGIHGLGFGLGPRVAVADAQPLGCGHGSVMAAAASPGHRVGGDDGWGLAVLLRVAGGGRGGRRAVSSFISWGRFRSGRLPHLGSAKPAWKRRVHPHGLHHTFACELLFRGVDVVSISKLLGHSSVVVTQRYLNLTNDQANRETRGRRLAPTSTSDSCAQRRVSRGR
jgi:hypothetical protein